MTSPTAEERDALGRSLYKLLFLVSGADGVSTRGEVAALHQALDDLDAQFGAGHAAGIDRAPASLDRARRASEGAGIHLMGDEFQLARRALDRMPSDLRARYEAFFLDACLRVAEASGGFLGLTSAINEDERAVLREIVRWLGVRVEI